MVSNMRRPDMRSCSAGWVTNIPRLYLQIRMSVRSFTGGCAEAFWRRIWPTGVAWISWWRCVWKQRKTAKSVVCVGRKVCWFYRKCRYGKEKGFNGKKCVWRTQWTFAFGRCLGGCFRAKGFRRRVADIWAGEEWQNYVCPDVCACFEFARASAVYFGGGESVYVWFSTGDEPGGDYGGRSESAFFALYGFWGYCGDVA